MPQHHGHPGGVCKPMTAAAPSVNLPQSYQQRQKESEQAVKAEVLWPSAQAAAQRTFGSWKGSILA